MADPQPGTPQWHALVTEPIIDPDRVIVDPHHHLWHFAFGSRYLLEDLWADTGSGHNVAKTVYLECGSFYREDGPTHLRAVGETEAVREVAEAVATAIVQLLSNRYGDGFVYLHGQDERGLYEQAKHLGLICSEGYLTPVGRSLIRRCGQG